MNIIKELNTNLRLILKESPTFLILSVGISIAIKKKLTKMQINIFVQK